MPNFPITAEFNRLIPKQEFYENLSVTPDLKRVFIDQKMMWYGISLSVCRGTDTSSFGSLSRTSKISTSAMVSPAARFIVSAAILFLQQITLILRGYGGKYQAWMAYKEETASGSNAFKAGIYCHTGWLPESELPLKIDGLDVDNVYESFVRQITGDASQTDNNETLNESAERDKRRQQLKKQIAALQEKVRKEKQLNK